MTTSRFERLLPLAGVLGGVVFAVATIMTMNEPTITDGEQKYVRWYADHGTTETVAGIGAAYFCVFMLLFATAVNRALRSGERGSAAQANAALAGAVIAGSGISLMGALGLANVEAADKHNAQAVTSLGYLSDSIWIVFIAGLAVFYIASGLGALRTGILPKWLAIVTIVLGVLCLLGPTGIGAFYATPVWLIVTGALLHHRQTAATIAAPRTSRSAVGASN